MNNKINKSDFLQNIAIESNIDLTIVCAIYDAIVDNIEKAVIDGKSVSFTGFGTFSLKDHKGHPVQFDAAKDTIANYVVLKFVPSGVFMAKIRDKHKQNEVDKIDEMKAEKG